MSRFIRIALLAVLSLFPVFAQTAPDRALLVISVDGMRPDYVSAADQHGLKIPNLRRILATHEAVLDGLRKAQGAG